MAAPLLAGVNSLAEQGVPRGPQAKRRETKDEGGQLLLARMPEKMLLPALGARLQEKSSFEPCFQRFQRLLRVLVVLTIAPVPVQNEPTHSAQ